MPVKKGLKEPILALRAHGLSYRQIQKELKCSRSTIAHYLGVGQPEKSKKRQNDSRAKISAYIASVKDNVHCMDCGIAYRHWVMTFDHLYDKKFTIAQFRKHTNSLDVVKAEIVKCEIVCANCHADRTHMRLIDQHVVLDMPI